MTLTHCYLTVEELQDTLRDQLTAFEGEYERAINAASRQIDTYCGRQFWLESTPSARVFRPDCSFEVWTGDIGTSTGLVVKTDDDDDGTFETTWASTDYQLEPFERINSRPYERLSALGSAEFPTSNTSIYSGSTANSRPSRRARVQITASWGWPSVPSEVTAACSILAVDHFKSKDLSNIASQYGSGTRFVRELTAKSFGAGGRFTRLRAPIFNPEAEALLQPLRVVVVA